MQSERDPLPYFRAFSILESNLKAKGVHPMLGRDFAWLDAELSSQKSRSGSGVKGELLPHFSPMLNTYAPKEAFWLTLNNEAGEIVAVIAARLNDLGSQPLTRHLEAYWTRCYRSEGGHPVAVRRQDDLFSDAITGRIVYLGELFVSVHWRGRDLSRLLCRLAQVVAFNLFEPDYLYAWMRPVHIEKGLHSRWGFSEEHRHAILWERGPASIDNDLAIVGNSAREGYRMIRLISEGFL
ncbi:hypothetical protein LC092_05745 [Stappia stellulata]|uniref:hypothetical protein n=1 Tax=Stappia TaxID=152161 RepID=UPI001CD65EF5|nr:hypothetical protein [Stappia stellulata]MCA1241932.1 hypothetical protein [Stappia stellulata]